MILKNLIETFCPNEGDRVSVSRSDVCVWIFKEVSFSTDSRGSQAFSLEGKACENGIKFRSHIDGSTHFFTPQKVLDIQYKLNSDIMMILDDLIALPAGRKRIVEFDKTHDCLGA